MKEISDLEIITGKKLVKQYHDEMIMDRIRAYGMHGYDITDPKTLKTDFYQKFMEERKREHDKEFIQRKVNDEKVEQLKQSMFEEIAALKRKKKRG